MDVASSDLSRLMTSTESPSSSVASSRIVAHYSIVSVHNPLVKIVTEANGCNRDAAASEMKDQTEVKRDGAAVDIGSLFTTPSVLAENSEEKMRCSFCTSQYSNRASLLNHVRNKHPNMSLERSKRKTKTSSGNCEPCVICGASFSNKSNLSRHYRTVHAFKEGVVDSKGCKEEIYKCNLCDYETRRKDNLTGHERVHKEKHSQEPAAAPVKCTLCSFESSRELLAEHFQNVHDIALLYEKHEFRNFETFMVWKAEVERDCLSNFSCYSTHKTKSGCSKTVYRCHRDGVYKPRGSNARRVKSLGTNKIGGCCPAFMHATTHPEGKVSVSFCKTHVGHQGDVGRMRLSTKERTELARKIAAGIPFEHILDSARESFSLENGVERQTLLSKKDLHNITRDFDLKGGIIRHSNDMTSVISWVREMETHNTVRFFKPQGELLPEYPQLAENDFVLIVMNEAQVEIFLQFATNVVCIDDIHDLNRYGFLLTTILVLDELGQGFPTAFMFSTRNDLDTMEIFIKKVREAVFSKVKPQVLMTDMAKGFVKAWCLHMHAPGKHSICAWHVDRDWRKTILLKVKGKNKQMEVYKMIRALLEEPDSDAFETMLNLAVQDMESDPRTTEFAEYFLFHYGSCPQQWAYCMKQRAEVNTNMALERMHGVLKHIYLNGKKPKRMDMAIHGLMRFLRDKFFDRLIRLSKAKVTSKLSAIQERHQESLSIAVESVIDGKTKGHFQVLSSSGCRTYDVKKTGKQHCKCALNCEECNSCIHMLECSCSDSAIKFNFCKHSHLVCQVLKQLNIVSDTGDDSDELSYHDSHFEELIVQDCSSALVTSESPLHDINIEKRRLEEEFSDIINQVQTLDDVDLVDRNLESLVATLQSQQCQRLSF